MRIKNNWLMQIGKGRYYLLILFFCLLPVGCKVFNAIVGIDEADEKKIGSRNFSVEFTHYKINRHFQIDKMPGKNVILLPTRSGMGGGSSDDTITASLNKILQKAFDKSQIITDSEIDDHFTDIDMWDDYFAYIESYGPRGIASEADMDKFIKLYAALKPDYVVTATSDRFMLGTEGFYPQVFNVYIDLQIWDIKTKQKVWGGTSNGETLLNNKKEEGSIYQQLSDRLVQRIAEELINQK